MNEPSNVLVRVSGDSSPFKTAGAIAGILREQRSVVVQAIGAAAVNQALKALIYARGYLQQDNLDFTIVPSFNEIEIEGAVKTAVRMVVEAHARPSSEAEPHAE